MKADLAIYTHVLGVPGQYESVALMLSHKMDFNCCGNRDGFRRDSRILRFVTLMYSAVICTIKPKSLTTRHFLSFYSRVTVATARDWPIMLIFLPIMLCCSAHKIYLLCPKLWSRIRIVLSLYVQICMNKSLLIVDNLESMFY